MEEEVKQVKMILRSLVVTSPSQMDANRLHRYYSKLLGAPIPLAKWGYRDFVAFLRERCSDSFLLTDPPSNPILTVIVPASSKHIDNFVQKSRVPSTSKFKTKRRSIPEAKVKPPEQDLFYESYAKRENSSDKDRALSLSQADDSRIHTLSSSSSTKAINKIKTIQFEKLKSEIMELITAAPEGVWCTDLIRLYRERYNRELNFMRFGCISILNLAYALEARVQITRPTDTGDWRLTERHGAGPAVPCPASAPRPIRAADAPPPAPDPDDALPGIDFDPDVFPADCVRFLEQIPALSLADWRPGATLEVMVGEMYSPSHFWLNILGKNYNIATEEMMDEMMLYYNGEGRARGLARGALRVGHYCAALYESDWHRAVIVKIIDSDTVKVRYVDYGTVGAVESRGLRPLLRRWARLPAQAVRARLAGVRPAADGQRWPDAAAAHLLRAVRDVRLVANVLAVDTEHDALETLLIDTRGADDVCLSSSLISAGHANMRADSALRAAECYLDPKFDALERGDTPNLTEINVYLRDGIALDDVEAYRLHVPMCLPAPTCLPAPVCLPAPACVPLPSAAAPPASPQDSEDSTLHDFYVDCSPPSPEPGELATRIPLLWPDASSSPAPVVSSPAPVVPSPAPVVPTPSPVVPFPAPVVPSPAFEIPASILLPCPAPPPCPSPLPSSSRAPTSASPSPLPHTSSALSGEQAPPDPRPPAVSFKPSVTKKAAINPRGSGLHSPTKLSFTTGCPCPRALRRITPHVGGGSSSMRRVFLAGAVPDGGGPVIRAVPGARRGDAEPGRVRHVQHFGASQLGDSTLVHGGHAWSRNGWPGRHGGPGRHVGPGRNGGPECCEGAKRH